MHPVGFIIRLLYSFLRALPSLSLWTWHGLAEICRRHAARFVTVDWWTKNSRVCLVSSNLLFGRYI